LGGHGSPVENLCSNAIDKNELPHKSRRVKIAKKLLESKSEQSNERQTLSSHLGTSFVSWAIQSQLSSFFALPKKGIFNYNMKVLLRGSQPKNRLERNLHNLA